MELRERVARAICLANGANPEDSASDMDQWSRMWTRYRTEADAAIAAVLDAMQEPSEGMIQAAYTASVDYFVGDEITGKGFRLAYSAMLAAFRTEAWGEG